MRNVRAAIMLMVLCVTLVGLFASAGVAIPSGSTISGVITTIEGPAAAGVTVSLYLGTKSVAIAKTNAEGRYTFSGVAAGSYVVYPCSSAMSFTPGYRAVEAPPGTTSANFVGSYYIAGSVKTAGGAPVAGVGVALYQGATLKLTSYTYDTGRYYFVNLPPGEYSVCATLTGKVFAPAYRDVTLPPSTNTADFVCSDQTYSISGHVTAAGGGGLAGIAVMLYQGDTKKAQATTGAEGAYSFTGVPAGTYTVKPLNNTMTFDPGAKVVTVPADAADVDFVGSYVIAGNIKTPEGAPLPNITVGLYLGDVLKAVAMSGGTGRYYFLRVPTGNYTVKPIDPGISPTPASRPVSVPPGTYTADFVCAAASYALLGQIKDATGAPVPNITVELYQGQTLMTTTTTDAEGRYTFSHLGGGTYTAHPIADGISFDPAYRTVTVGPSRTGVNFTTKASGFSLGGFIKTVGGTAVSNVTLGLYQGETLKSSTTTDGSGHYVFTGVAAGTYRVRPSHGYVSFDPQYRDVTVGPSTDAANFIAASVAYTIAGFVKTAGAVAIPNVTVSLYQGDTLKRTTSTGSDGRYVFTNIVAGNYTVKPAASGMTFDPTYRAVTVGPSQEGVNFTATAGAISGLIKTAAGAAISGCHVELYREATLIATTTTNADGRYYFVNLAAGTYAVKPTRDGTVFDPYYRMVTVPPNVLDAHFHSTN